MKYAICFLVLFISFASISAGSNKDRTKERKKRKVARQIISFDDDTDSMLSTSIPSSSSSISSDNNSINENPSSSNSTKKQLLNQISEEAKMSKPEKSVESQRKLSIETRESREKYQSQMPESLTPIIQNEEIGELKPISVEINTNFESPDASDDILEIPTDISAVLTAVETKNLEELNKKQNKIELLIKENEGLKDQVKKYVGAIKMLKREDGTYEEVLQELELNDEQADYRGEAKIFEKKLVQVAEMHAELIDFNSMLQQSLCQKDKLLERLKSELEELRGPMATDELATEHSGGNVSVWIPSAYLTGTGSSSHHVYQVFLRAGNDEWNIYRRYAQFYALHVDLKKLDPAVATFDFPPKKSIGKKDSTLVEDRRKRLQKYLRRILAHWPELSHCGSRFLLEQHLAFFKDQKEVDSQKNNKKSIFSPRRNHSNDNHYAGL